MIVNSIHLFALPFGGWLIYKLACWVDEHNARIDARGDRSGS